MTKHVSQCFQLLPLYLKKRVWFLVRASSFLCSFGFILFHYFYMLTKVHFNIFSKSWQQIVCIFWFCICFFGKKWFQTSIFNYVTGSHHMKINKNRKRIYVDTQLYHFIMRSRFVNTFICLHFSFLFSSSLIFGSC